MVRVEGATKGVAAGETVTIPQASALLQKPDGTVRDWVRKGLVRAKQDPRGRWLIERESLLAHAAVKAPKVDQRRASNPKPSLASPLDDGISKYIRTLEDSLTREQKLNDELRSKNDFLQGELLKLTAEIKAILAREDKSLLSRWIRG